MTANPPSDSSPSDSADQGGGGLSHSDPLSHRGPGRDLLRGDPNTLCSTLNSRRTQHVRTGPDGQSFALCVGWNNQLIQLVQYFLQSITCKASQYDKPSFVAHAPLRITSQFAFSRTLLIRYSRCPREASLKRWTYLFLWFCFITSKSSSSSAQHVLQAD